jgi:hypothetical protein
VRSRQLEGTYPGDRRTGAWITTDLRVRKAWGWPADSEWPHFGPVEPPGIDQRAKANRPFAYGRVRTIDDCRFLIAGRQSLPFCAFEIDDSWWKAPGGSISDPSGQRPTGKSHAARLRI